MFFKQYKVQGLGCYSYMIGCPAEATACVVDPERHIQQYIDDAESNGLKITAIFDTHIHADHITGSAELACATGAPIYISHEADVKYPHNDLSEGDIFKFGSAELRVLETPGHTPNSVSFVITDLSRSADPFGILTGDLLFVGDIGRPDLAGENLLTQQVKNLYESLYIKLAKFPDWIEVYPAHGQGSLCGKGMSSKPMTTLGFERRNNKLLNNMPYNEFHKIMTSNFQTRPDNFITIVDKNSAGPKLIRQAEKFRPLTNNQTQREIDAGATLVDVRNQTSFGSAFIDSSINIGLSPNSVNWLGMFVPAEQSIVIIANSAQEAHEANHIFKRAGYDNIVGYVSDGLTSWASQARPLNHLPQLTVEGVKRVLEKYPDHVVIDVRSEDEFHADHIEAAINIPATTLVGQPIDIPKDKYITVVCASGYRSNIAGSFLKSQGYQHVYSLIGGMTAWKNFDRH